MRSFIKYAQPYFDRADQVARSTQRLFIWLTRLLYALAAVAVVVVATQIIFLFFHDPKIVWAEFAALLTVVLTLVFGRRGHWHDRWLAARSLAERIRSRRLPGCRRGRRWPAAESGPEQKADRRAGRTSAPSGRAGAPPPRSGRGSPVSWVAFRYGARRIWSTTYRTAGGHQPGQPAFRRMRSYPPDSGQLDPNQEWVERAFREIYWGGPRVPPGQGARASPSCAACW